jgi:hypothetical protein
MFALSLLSLALVAAEPTWHDDYDTAARQAIEEKKDLVIHFRADNRLDAVLRHPEVVQRLQKFICLEVTPGYKRHGERLLDHSSLADMMGQPGLVIVSLRDKNSPNYCLPISAHPLVASRYRWVPAYGVEEVKLILDLPPHASLTQRSMIYAVTVHPERPQSVHGECHWSLLAHAERHSKRQAALQNQHHADIIAASHRFRSEAGIPAVGGTSEVVAESWGRFFGGENVLEAAFSCVDAWRQSPGHWGAVARRHRYYGYDIAKGANGTWYATGIFVD